MTVKELRKMLRKYNKLDVKIEISNDETGEYHYEDVIIGSDIIDNKRVVILA